MGSRADSITLAQEVDLLWISTLDTDVLNLHAAVHVEGFPFQQGSNLDTNEVLLVVEEDDGQLLSEGSDCRVLSCSDHEKRREWQWGMRHEGRSDQFEIISKFSEVDL